MAKKNNKKITIKKQDALTLYAKVTVGDKQVKKLSKRDLSILEELVVAAATEGYILSEITLERCPAIKDMDILNLNDKGICKSFKA